MKTLKKKLITSSILTLIAFFLFGFAASLAWMSANDKVGGNGMNMTIEKNPYLVMSTKNGTKGEGSTSIFEITTSNLDYISFDWSDTTAKLSPATHDWVNGTETGLVYNNNPARVSKQTGLDIYNDASGLKFTAVPNYTSGSRYYIDYVVYVASVLVEFKDFTKFYASIEELGSPKATNTNFGYKATSIDFYVSKVSKNETVIPSSTTFKGTLNLSNTSNKIDLLASTEITTIPVNTNNSIAILMRCYFDGALTYDDNSQSPAIKKAYINSDQMALTHAMVKFKVSLELE